MKNYNIGAGSFRHENWINIDHSSIWYKHLQEDIIEYDLLEMNKLPLEDNSVDNIYSSHVIEHVTDEAVQNMCNECYRVLKRGGFIRIQAPNIDIFYSYFIKNKKSPWLAVKKPAMSKKSLYDASPEQVFLWSFASNVTTLHKDGAQNRLNDKDIKKIFKEMSYENALNKCLSFISIDKQRFYPGNHINWWNPKKLIRFLKISGFNKIYESSFGKSKSKYMRDTKFFDNKHKSISFYVEAIK